MRAMPPSPAAENEGTGCIMIHQCRHILPNDALSVRETLIKAKL
jgi:hypothetical protein